MKKTAIQLIALIAAVAVLGSCATLLGSGSKDTVPNMVKRNLQEFESVAVIGYNTTRGFDDRLLDDVVKTSPFDIGLEISIESDELKFPIGDRINTYEQYFLEALQNGPLSVAPKADVVTLPEYQEIKGDVDADLSNVHTADGYRLTWEFSNWMDNAHSASQAQVPDWGSIINNYRDTLEAAGVDCGIIVVERPYIKTVNYSLIDEWFKDKEDYFAVATANTYVIVRPAMGNQVVYQKTIYSESDTRYSSDNYTPEMRAEDEAGFLDEVTTVSQKSHDAFVEWMNTVWAPEA